MSETFPGRSISVDGYQLMFPGTGLSVATAEILKAFAGLPECSRINLLIPDGLRLADVGLDHAKIFAHRIAFQTSRTDYVTRWRWGGAAARALRRIEDGTTPHYLPYLFNYGSKSRNTVVVPDLAYRLYPDYGQRRPGQAFWDPRGRLPIRPLVRRLEERAVAAAGRLITYSAFVRDHAAEVFGRPKDSFRIVPLAASPFFATSPAPSDLASFSAKHALPGRFVLYVGGYAARKNIPNLLQACGLLHASSPGFRCAFVGLDDHGVRSRPEIAELLRDSSIASAVIPLPRLSDHDVRTAYHACSFAVYPSMNEGFGLPILEAAASGRLSVCGDNSSLREIQTDPAFRFDSADPSAIAACMGRFWTDATALAGAAAASRALNDRYSWTRTAQETWRCMFDSPSA